jgi:hypothetical protein
MTADVEKLRGAAALQALDWIKPSEATRDDLDSWNVRCIAIGDATSVCCDLLGEITEMQADRARLDWLDANGFSAYRSIDPIDGLSEHVVVVHETMRPRRGHVHDAIRKAIDAAIADAQKVEPNRPATDE